ncbi:MAG TPA: hypothetical protein VNA69_07575 [Thermoanaerobaculia bacterium]|nr:hypothetical protein [Thermoanaerobaculia bacterium]
MGKQVEFYMTPVDEAAFIEHARTLCWLRIMRNTFADRSGMNIDHLEPLGTFLGDADVHLTCASFAENIVVLFTPQTGLYSVDFMNSESVQFSRSTLDSERRYLREGRLWFDTRRGDEKKSDAFTRWADKLLSYIRRRYRLGENRRFVGSDAWQQSDSGALQLGAQAVPLSKEEALRKLGLK